MPGAYVSLEDVKALIPRSSGERDTDGDALYENVIKHVLRRIDRRAGQYFYGGETGFTYNLKRLEYHRGGMLVFPRFASVTRVERQQRVGADWETLDSADYELSAEMEAWLDSGVDTVRLIRARPGRYRIVGNIGWGHPDFDTDPVPEDLPMEANIAIRYKAGRVGLGAPGGGVMSGNLQVDLSDSWEFPWSTKSLVQTLVDPRRLQGRGA